MEYPKIYHFKMWVYFLNGVVSAFMVLVGAVLLWSILRIFEWAQNDFLLLTFAGFLTWGGVDEVFKNVLPYFPKGVALELHDDHIKVASCNGLIVVPRKGVRGCKQPKSLDMHTGRGGRVEVSVRDEYKVTNYFGRKVNPSFHGASVQGENATTLTRAIRDWRKMENSD